MHLLLSNDDGYQAQGIQILAKHLQSLGHKITVVAPSGEQSAQSHAMTFYQPIRVRQILENTYAVDGSPADCVALALTKILPPHEKPDFVIAGINHGLNVGIDVNYSGTVGAATEASLMGYKAIAVSADVQQKKNYNALHTFSFAAQIVAQVLQQKIHWPKLEVLNINVPIDAKSFAVAACDGESLYVPNYEELIPKQSTDMKIYLIGGMLRYEPQDKSQDVSLISSGHVTLSFVRAKQGSTQSNKNLEKILNHLKI